MRKRALMKSVRFTRPLRVPRLMFGGWAGCGGWWMEGRRLNVGEM